MIRFNFKKVHTTGEVKNSLKQLVVFSSFIRKEPGISSGRDKA